MSQYQPQQQSELLQRNMMADYQQQQLQQQLQLQLQQQQQLLMQKQQEARFVPKTKNKTC
jgi:hypothetical protein